MTANITRVRKRIEEDRAFLSRPPWIDPKWTPLPDTWPTMVLQRLRRNGVETWQQLEQLTEAEALGWVGVGRDTIATIRRLCDEAKPRRVIQRTAVWGAQIPGPSMVMSVQGIMLRPDSTSGVYFIQSGSFIKIGVSSLVRHRLKALAQSNPHDLTGLGFIPAADEAYSIETSLHERFASHRHRGEWFHDHAELRAYIQEHAKPWPNDL